MVSYRFLSAEEMPTAVHLWVSVFGVEAPFFESLLAGGDPDDFSLGAFDNGRLVSSVHVFIRWFRDRSGEPQKVGGIGSVSTLPEARSQGHSQKLLTMAIEEMERRDCIWSALGTGVNDHYARHGWRTISSPYFRGSLKPGLTAPEVKPVTVSEELLLQMEGVHIAYSRSRPMANDRSKRLWQHSALYRTTRPHHQVFTKVSGETMSAYLVCGASEDQIELIEGAHLDGHSLDLQQLIENRLAVASEQKVKTAYYHLAEESGVFPAFSDSCSMIWPAEGRGWTARPIAQRISWPELASIHADPRGTKSDLDNF